MRSNLSIVFLLLTFVTFLVARATALVDWRARKNEVIQSSPFFGRTLLREELPAFNSLLEAAQLLPRRSCNQEGGEVDDNNKISLAYLIQGEEDVFEKEAAMWLRDSNSVETVAFVLTFRTQRPDALYFPNSILAEGRNALIAAAAFEEFRRGERFTYYVMLDADAVLLPSWNYGLLDFETFLAEWEPAVGVPGPHDDLSERPADDDTPMAIFQFDHIFMAIHTEAISSLLPYDTAFDTACNWVSQWKLTAIAGALYRNHVLVLPKVKVKNPNHSEYPKDDCLHHMENVSVMLREKAPEDAQSCFPPPLQAAVKLPGGMTYGAYLQWGEARKKGVLDNYTATQLEHIQPCNEEAFIQALDLNTPAGWCRGCNPQESFFLLQAMTASKPQNPGNWNALGVWLKGIGENYAGDEANRRIEVEHIWMSAVCLAIADRLLSFEKAKANRGGKELTRHQEILINGVANNLHFLENDLIKAGLKPPGPWLWQEEYGLTVVEQIISTSLLVQAHFQDLRLMEAANIRDFVYSLAADKS